MKFRKNLLKLSLGFAILSLGFSSTAFAMESLPEEPSIESLNLDGLSGLQEKARFASPFAYGEIAVETDNPYNTDNDRKNYRNEDQLKGGFKRIITEYFKRFSKEGEESINNFDDVCEALNLGKVKKDGVLNFLVETFKYYIKSRNKVHNGDEESKNKAHNGDEARVLLFWNEAARQWQVQAGFSPQALLKKLRKEKDIEINPSDFKNICCKIKTKGKITEGKDKGKEIERVLEIPSSNGTISNGTFVRFWGDVDAYGRDKSVFDAYALSTEKSSKDFNMFVPDANEKFGACEVELYYGSFDAKNLMCSLKGEVQEVKNKCDFSMVDDSIYHRVEKFNHPKYFDIIFWFKYYMTEVLDKSEKLAEVLK